MTDRMENRNVENDAETVNNGWIWSALKFTAALAFLSSSAVILNNNNKISYANDAVSRTLPARRRLKEEEIPAYIEPLLEDLKERKKLMEETPPAEVKYWFEYTGPLQVRILSLTMTPDFPLRHERIVY